MKKNKEIKISKINNKEEKLDIRGQGCFSDCRVWYGHTTVPKCELKPTCSTTCFL